MDTRHEHWTVYVDESGKLNNEADDVFTMGLVAMPSSVERQVSARLEHVRAVVRSRSISDAPVELHVASIVNSRDSYSMMSEEKRSDVLRRIGAAFRNTDCRFAAVVLLRDEGGFETLKHMAKRTVRRAKDSLSPEDMNLWHCVESELAAGWKKKGLGKVGVPLGLLMGLGTGILSWESVSREATVVVDEQLVAHFEGLRLLAQVAKQSWILLPELVDFHLWPRQRQPRWLLGDKPEEKASKKVDGLQLADFVASTVCSIWTAPHGIAAANCPISREDVKFIGDLPGVGMCAHVDKKDAKACWKRQQARRQGRTTGH